MFSVVIQNSFSNYPSVSLDELIPLFGYKTKQKSLFSVLKRLKYYFKYIYANEHQKYTNYLVTAQKRGMPNILLMETGLETEQMRNVSHSLSETKHTSSVTPISKTNAVEPKTTANTRRDSLQYP